MALEIRALRSKESSREKDSAACDDNFALRWPRKPSAFRLQNCTVEAAFTVALSAACSFKSGPLLPVWSEENCLAFRCVVGEPRDKEEKR